MYKRKAFLHWYKDEGMDEMEFTEGSLPCAAVIRTVGRVLILSWRSGEQFARSHVGGSLF